MSAAQIRFLQQALPEQLAVNQLEMSLARLDWLDQGIHVNQRAGTSVNFSEGLIEILPDGAHPDSGLGTTGTGAFLGPGSGGRAGERPADGGPGPANGGAEETTVEAIVLGWLMKHPAMIQPVIGTTNVERIIACQDAERQAQLMTREEWYTLYVRARGANMP